MLFQKYRLHTRRPSPSSNNAQAPQFVVVGGIWMPPPPEYTATAATTEEAGLMIRSSNGIYAPKATMPKMRRQPSEADNSDKNGSYSQTRSRSNSPESSSF